MKQDPRSMVSPIIPSSQLDLGPSSTYKLPQDTYHNNNSNDSVLGRSSLKKSFYNANSSKIESDSATSSAYRVGSRSRSKSRPPTGRDSIHAVGGLPDDNKDRYIDDVDM